MANAGMTVNYALNQIMNDEARTQSPAALASACRALNCPVLLIQGAGDPRPVAACDSLASALPLARRVILPAGHLPWIEAPEQFSAALRGFLASINPDDAA